MIPRGGKSSDEDAENERSKVGNSTKCGSGLKGGGMGERRGGLLTPQRTPAFKEKPLLVELF